MKYQEIESEDQAIQLLKLKDKIDFIAFQNINFELININLFDNKIFYKCIFLACKMPVSSNLKIFECMSFPQLDVPYNMYVKSLYNKVSLFDKYTIGKYDSYKYTLDNTIYQHYLKTGKQAQDIKETLARRLHDHSISNALYDYIRKYDETKIIAVMGGHNIKRGDENYLKVALLSKKLSELSYLMVSGGGPGAMEATHLGAWFAGRNNKELLDGINILKKAPLYTHKQWLDKAFVVMEKYPQTQYESLGIPTWLYGHEPPTPFATHIAKYFANSVREDGLLSIAKGGIIFSPGSAGTVQEIFQEATQNHYKTHTFASPMIFLDTLYWNNTMPIYPLLKKLLDEKKYKNLILSCHDSPESIINDIINWKI